MYIRSVVQRVSTCSVVMHGWIVGLWNDVKFINCTDRNSFFLSLCNVASPWVVNSLQLRLGFRHFMKNYSKSNFTVHALYNNQWRLFCNLTVTSLNLAPSHAASMPKNFMYVYCFCTTAIWAQYARTCTYMYIGLLTITTEWCSCHYHTSASCHSPNTCTCIAVTKGHVCGQLTLTSKTMRRSPNACVYFIQVMHMRIVFSDIILKLNYRSMTN